MYPDDVGHLHQHSHLLKIPIAVAVKVPLVENKISDRGN